MKVLRKAYVFVVPLILLLLCLVMPAAGQGGSGSIWTTSTSCGDEEQNSNHFKSGDEIWINGSNFNPGTYDWSIYGNPGGSSCDPGITVASGTVTVDASRSFCFSAYVVQPDDCGEYRYNVGSKNDNYRVEESSTLILSEINATSSWEEQISWEISKSATPEEVALFKGDEAEITWIVAVDKTAVTSPAVISGTVKVDKVGVAPEDFSLTITLSQNNSVVDEVVINTYKASGNYDYSFTLAAPAEGEYVVSAVVSCSNGTGDSGSEPVELTKTVVGPASIHVTDGNSQWQYGDDGSASYTTTIACEADAGRKSNTATITETGQSATAEVLVECYELEVEKSAETSYKRTYQWKIDKKAEEELYTSSIQLPIEVGADGLSTVVKYQVDVDVAGYTDSDWAASGEIHVSNPAPIPAVIESISDLIPGITSVEVTCSVTFPYTLAANSDMTCTWSAPLPDATGRTNTATATLVNHRHTAQGAIASGTTDFSGTAQITFGAPTEMIDHCVQVDDNLEGALGTVCADQTPKSFQYNMTWGPWSKNDCGQSYTKVNTATLTTADTKTILSASAEVILAIICQEAVGTTIEAEIDQTGHWTAAWKWGINKTVEPASWDLFKGDTGTSTYTIAVTRESEAEEAWLEGVISVTNTGALPTRDLAITLNVVNGYAPPDNFSAAQTIDVSGNPVLDPNETGLYPWRIDIPVSGGSYPQPHAGGDYTATATITITNYDGQGDTPYGPSPVSSKAFPAAPAAENASVNVDDSNGSSWSFAKSGSVSYTRTFACDEGAGEHKNTATIRETGQKSSAVVNVACHELEVHKSAKSCYDRSYTWKLTKTGDQREIMTVLQRPIDPKDPGLKSCVNYTVTAEVAGYVDNGWSASGEIHISNPAPIAAVISGISDVIPGVDDLQLECGVTFPYTLEAGEELTCTWAAKLPDGSKRTNTATVTLVNHDYGVQGAVPAQGTTEFSGSAEVEFGLPSHLINDRVKITDNQQGPLGELCAADAPKSYKYNICYGPWSEEDCGESYTKTNTATLLACDSQVPLEASWDVVIKIRCDEPPAKPLGVRADCIDPYVYSPTIRVHFVVTNPNAYPVTVPHGIANAIDPAKYQGEQPTLFAPGETEWEIEIGKYEVITWQLQGTSAIANMKTNICTYAGQDDVYIAGVGVFYDTNHNGRYETGETLLAPDFEGNIAEVYLVDKEGKTVDSRVLNPGLMFRAGREVNWNMRQVWGEHYLVAQLRVPLPAGYRIYPNYRLIHTPEFPEPFYGLENDFGLVPAGFVPDSLANLDLPPVAALAPYLNHPVQPGVAGIVSESAALAAVPEAFMLHQNYPNPFNPQTTISYDLPEQAHVTLTVYDVTGKIVARLTDGLQDAGTHVRIWEAGLNPSGIYYCVLQSGSFKQIRQMLLMK